MPYHPKNVRAEMARRSMTNEDVAAKANLSPSTVQRATTDGGNPTAETIQAIAEALEVDPVTFWRNPRQTA